MRRLFIMSYETSLAPPIDRCDLGGVPRDETAHPRVGALRHEIVTFAAQRLAGERPSPQDVAVSDGDWRKRRWDATHRRIYETAMRLFQEHGFEQVSIGQLVAAAEVSPPTFYAHYPSKEHLVMQVPTAELVAALLAAQPGDLPVATRVRELAREYIAQWSPEEKEHVLARWKVVAATPALRNQAAAFERTTAGLVADALPPDGGPTLDAADAVIVDAHLAAYTRALLAWADSDGQHDLETLIGEAFDALKRGGAF
jgi:AcrR family transcriptional regulator